MKVKLFLTLIFIFALAFLPLDVLSFDENTARAAYLDVEKKVSELQKEGYPTLPIIDILAEAEAKYNIGDYNSSLSFSKEALAKGDQIIIVHSILLTLTDDLEILNSLGFATDELDISLLYAKSDFESANIDLSEKEAAVLSEKIYQTLLNYSRNNYEILKAYHESYVNTSKDISSDDFFIRYYEKESEFYRRQEYSLFLKGFLDFDDIKNIIIEHDALLKNIEVINQEKISFLRLNDSLSLFEEEINSQDYSLALKTLSEINTLLMTAITLKEEMVNITVYYNNLDAQGIIDNKTFALFESAKKEFSLENYLDAKLKADETKKALYSLESKNIIFGGLKKASLKKGLKDFFLNNWLALLVIFIISLIAYKPSKAYLLLRYSQFRLRKLNDENNAIKLLQIELQKQYFIEHFIDKKTYKEEFTKFEERKSEIENRLDFFSEKSNDYKTYLKKLKKLLNFRKE